MSASSAGLEACLVMHHLCVYALLLAVDTAGLFVSSHFWRL